MRTERETRHGVRFGGITAALITLCTLALAGPAAAQQAVANPHGTLPEGLDCAACHTAEGWSTLRRPLAFDHAKRTGFALSGAHAQAPCAQCHLDLRFDEPKVMPDDCASCHADVHEGRMVQECTACHNTRSFHDVDGEIIHARTSFPLTGAHRQITCESCHINDVGGAFTALDTDCVSCHESDYRQAQTVDHVAGGYPTDCTRCHTTLGWSDAPAFDHESVSGGFALIGAHTGLRCASCHEVPGMRPLFQASSQNDCVACHQADYDREHGGGNFPTTCLDCHTVDSWEGADLDHSLTGFALVGSHATLACSACHTADGRQLKFPAPSEQNDCAACHQADYDREHSGSGFPETCLSCHNVNTWDGADFDHATTSFPLMGAHAPLSCAACHGPPDNLAAKPTTSDDCVACHQTDYDREHGGSSIPTTCSTCHTQSSWEGASADHALLSGGFSLTGPHANAQCTACHSVPGYGLLYPAPGNQDDCAACHQADYDNNHAGSGFPTTCLSCHQADRWDGASFDHGTTGFALVGAHAPLTCASCHGPPTDLSGLPTSANDCVACHQSDYDREHGGSAIPTTCMSCHTQSTWSGATVDHASLPGGFALTGPHATAQCTACHAVPSYTLLFPKPAGQNDCVSCHQADYDREHAGSGFPTTCLSCHSATTWSGATLDHGQISGGFQLLGSHATAQCTACHAIPGYALLFTQPSSQNDCVACHQAQYNGAHAGTGMPTDCAACHNTTAWTPSSFDHDAQYFPIYSGPHQPVWSTCATCHTTPGDLSVFSCTDCHQKSETDGHHREVNGYVYESGACYSCHPRGRSGG